MTIVALMPRSFAARPRAWAWLPERGHHPVAALRLESWSSAFIAPRILNGPARCRFSHLRRTSTLHVPKSSGLRRVVVRVYVNGCVRLRPGRLRPRK